MKERFNHELPHPHFGGWGEDGKAKYRPAFLPDFVTLKFAVNGQECECEVEPTRVDWFKENFPKQIGQSVEWL